MSYPEDHPLRAFAPQRLLFVDDDPLITRIVVDHYTDLGFEVSTAGNGEEALRQMEQRLPDIVLCDRKMPVMSGAELIEVIRDRGPEWQQVTFIFVTSLNDRRDRYAMLPFRPDGFFYKPIDFTRDDLRLVEILQHKRASVPAP